MKPAEMRGRLSQEWESRGWEYDTTTGAGIIAAIERAGRVDPKALAASVDGGFLDRTGTTRAEVADAINSALGEAELTPSEAPAAGGISITAGGDVYFLQAPDSTFQGPVNQGGTQVNLDSGPRDEVLDAVGALFANGLRGDWDSELARAVSEAIEERQDIDVNQIQEAAIEVGKEEKPEPGRIQKLLEDVALSELKAKLAAGLSFALGQLPGLLG